MNNQVSKQGTQHITFLCASQVESTQQPSTSPKPQTCRSLLHPCSKPTAQLQPCSNTSLLLLSKVQPQTQPRACTYIRHYDILHHFLSSSLDEQQSITILYHGCTNGTYKLVLQLGVGLYGRHKLGSVAFSSVYPIETSTSLYNQYIFSTQLLFLW